MSRERWESSEIVRWERCVNRVRWQCGKGVWVELGGKVWKVGVSIVALFMGTLTRIWHTPIPLMMMMMMTMMMNCFWGMVDRRKTFSLISGRDHCQWSWPSRISDTPRAGFDPGQNLSSGLVEWSCAVVITTTPRRHDGLYPRFIIKPFISASPHITFSLEPLK